MEWDQWGATIREAKGQHEQQDPQTEEESRVQEECFSLKEWRNKPKSIYVYIN
jgi:hypothetical protein